MESNIEWRKSSYSISGGCVEVARASEAWLVRNSKDREGPILKFTQHEWDAFLAAAKAGEFDGGVA